MAVAKRTVELFYDVLSPYSWVAFEVLCRYRPIWNLDLHFRPFFLSGVMNSTGFVPAKSAYMSKDLRRLSEYYGIPLKSPTDVADVLFKKGNFINVLCFLPSTNECLLSLGSLSAMRLLTATCVAHPDKVEHVTRQLWLRIWSRDEDIVLPESLKTTCLASGLNETQTSALLSRLSDKDIKDKLKETTEEAIQAGSFGAPTVIAHHDGKKHMFFGSDRFLLLAHLFGVNWEGPLKSHSNL